MFFKNDNERKDSPAAGRRSAASAAGHHRVSRTWCAQLFVGRERSINALDEAMARDKEIFLAAQKNAKTNEPDARRHLPVGTLGDDHAAASPARRHREGAGRGQAARAGQEVRRRPSEYFLVEVEEVAEQPREERRGRGADALGAGGLRDVREAEQEDSARGPDERADDRRRRRASPTPSSPTFRPSSSPIARRCSRWRTRRSGSSASTS